MTDHEITPTDETLTKIMGEICASDPSAIQWFNGFREAVMFFDHVYDDDGNIPKDEVIRVMKALIVDWGLNPFFRKHSILLSVVILNSISAWEFSNIEGRPKFKSYDIYTEVATTMAFIFGGHDMVNKYIPTVRELVYKLYEEDESRDGGKK